MASESPISLFLPLTPVPAARPRVANGRAYTPEPYASWKDAAALFLRAHTRGITLPDGPLWLSVDVYHPRPTRRPGYVPPDVWKSGRATPAITRSDLDNHLKAVLDALQDSGALSNDNRIAHIVASSWFAADGGKVGAEIAMGGFSEDGVASRVTPR